MASRAEHYRKAEQCLEDADRAEWGSDHERFLLAAAKVHALLANAPEEVTAEAGTAPFTGTFDLTDTDACHVLTQALGDYAAGERG